MPDIIVTVPKHEIEHCKQSKFGLDGLFDRAWWRLPTWPKRFEQMVDRIGFVIEGAIRFIATDAWLDEREDAPVVEWDVESIKEIEPIPMKGFRGFRYYDLPDSKEG